MFPLQVDYPAGADMGAFSGLVEDSATPLRYVRNDLDFSDSLGAE